jgi:ribose-phosphate pyrophosphokinase
MSLSPRLADAPPSEPFQLRIIEGRANKSLGQEVCAYTGVKPAKVQQETESSGEIAIRLRQKLSGDDVYVMQPTCSVEGVDINDAVLELIFLIRRLKHASSRRITAVVPSFAYARQDRRMNTRVPVSAAAVADMMVQAGVDRIVTVDLHCGQIQGYTGNIPFDNLKFVHYFASYIRALAWYDPKTSVVVSPDAGGVDRARDLADSLGVAGVVTIVKRRVKAGEIESMQTVGEVNGFNVIIVDDIVDTGGTLIKACELLKSMGATRVTACITHGVMTDPCCKRVEESSGLDELVVSNSIPQEDHARRCNKLTTLSVAPLVAEAILRLHNDESLSALFKPNVTHAVVQ